MQYHTIAQIRNLSEKTKVNYSLKNILKYTQSDLGKKLKRLKLRTRSNKTSSLTDFHRIYILKKLRNAPLSIDTDDNIKSMTSSDFFLTKMEKTQKQYNQTTTTFFSSKTPLTERNRTNEVCKSHSNSKLITFNNCYKTNKYPLTFDQMISSCLKRINRKNYKKESLSQFNQRIKTSCVYNINTQNLLKRYKKIEETKENQIQEINMKIFFIEDTKIKFVHFMEHLIQYVRFLNNEIKRQRSIINDLYSYENDLQIDKLTLMTKIKKTIKILELYKQYKKFLLLVKYKKTKLSDIPDDILYKYGIEIKRKDDSSTSLISRKNIKRISKRFSVMSVTSNFSTLNSPKKKNSQAKIGKYASAHLMPNFTKLEDTNIPIFDSPEEFIKTMNCLEDDVRELFTVFSEIKYNHKNLYKEKASIKEYDNHEEKLNVKKQEYLIKELNNIKKNNEILQNKYKMLLNQSETKYSKKIFNKIKNILISLPINIEIDFNFINFYGLLNSKGPIIIQGKKYNKSIFGLKTLEAIILHYEELIKRAIMDPRIKNIYIDFVTELEKKKRYENNQQIKLKRQLKFEELSHKIMKRSKKVFVSTRKIDVYGNLLLRQRFEREEEIKRLNNLKKKKNNEYEDWIAY